MEMQNGIVAWFSNDIREFLFQLWKSFFLFHFSYSVASNFMLQPFTFVYKNVCCVNIAWNKVLLMLLQKYTLRNDAKFVLCCMHMPWIISNSKNAVPVYGIIQYKIRLITNITRLFSGHADALLYQTWRHEMP